MKIFVGYNVEQNIIKKSSSGGAFSAVTDYYFDSKDNVVVYGSIMTEDLKVEYIKATNKKDRDLMRGSKYIQANIKNTFQNIEKDILHDKYVIFIGTPCQVAAVRKYIKYRNLKSEKVLIIDFVCHGVSEEKFFRDYIIDKEKSYNSKAINCNFRTKKKRGKLQDMEITFKNGKKYYSSTSKFDWFYSVYQANLVMKKACYSCPFANLERNSDITLGDAWGFNVNGCESPSLIIANTLLGEKIIRELYERYMKLIEINVDEFNVPLNLREPTPKPVIYDEFWKIYNTDGYLEMQRYFGNNTIIRKLEKKIVESLDKLGIVYLLKKLKK